MQARELSRIPHKEWNRSMGQELDVQGNRFSQVRCRIPLRGNRRMGQELDVQGTDLVKPDTT